MFVWTSLALVQILIGYVIPLIVTVQKLSSGHYLACRKWLLFWIISTLLHEFILPILSMTVGYISPTVDQIVQITIAVFLLLPSFSGVDKIDTQIKKHTVIVKEKFNQHSQKAAKAVLLKSGLHHE